MGGNVIQPGKMQIQFDHVPTETAQTSATVLSGSGKLQMLAFGGFTKLEQAALQLAAGMAATGLERGQRVDARMFENLAIHAADGASAVLAECHRRELEKRGTKWEILARRAYEGYAQHTGFKSIATGDSLPRWLELAPPIQAAWQAAVMALMGKE